MNTDNDKRSEELNESELDSVAGGFGRGAFTPEQDPNDELADLGPEGGSEEPHNPEDDAPGAGGPIHI